MLNHAKLIAWRNSKEWTQTEAGKRFGVPQGTWAAWETGKKSPDRTNAPKLEEFTDGKVKAIDWPPRKKRPARVHPSSPPPKRRAA